jgi:hypothetical protein
LRTVSYERRRRSQLPSGTDQSEPDPTPEALTFSAFSAEKVLGSGTSSGSLNETVSELAAWLDCGEGTISARLQGAIAGNVKFRVERHGPIEESKTMSPMAFRTILRDELTALRSDLELPQNPTLDQLYETIDQTDAPLAALCLSGGGIRSASFALGVLQGLARFGLLSRFHYLSTVSGGGYIGSWLTAWRHHASSDEVVFDRLDRTRSASGAEADEIRGLRADSNYLTPKVGLLSADTWAAVALFIRNLVLNWLVFLPFFMGVLYFPWLCDDLVGLVSDRLELAVPLMWLGVTAITIGLTFASYGRRCASGAWLTDGRFILTVLGPIIIASMGFTAGLAALHQAYPSVLSGAIGGGVCYVLAWLLASAFRSRDPAPSSSRAALVDSESQSKDLVSWIVAGAVAGCLLAAGMHLSGMLSGRYRTEWLTVLGSSWTMLSIFGGELIYVGLRSYAKRGDMDREWLGRAAGWLTAGAVSWALIAAVALFGPPALNAGTTAIASWLTVGGISGAIAVTLANSTKTAATEAEQIASRFSLTQIASLAGVVFAVVLGICLSTLDEQIRSSILQPSLRWLVDLSGLVLLIALSAGISWFVNVNRFSLHALYRNRLVRAFLGSARATANPPREPDPFTGFDQADNLSMALMPKSRLLHVVNIALNVVSTKNLAWQERKAESFTVTPLATGNPNVGYRSTTTYGARDGGISLGTAMAISGAAVSPNMGYNSSPLLGFLLMLFNVRLGWWLGNPARPTYDREGPNVGIVPLLKELASQTTDQGRWVYLSDGGHFENLGVYEMVRRRCRVIVVSDAGCDPDCTFEDLGNAVRKIYIDQGVSIDFKTLNLSKRLTPPKSGSYCAMGRITYPGSPVPGWLLYIKPGYHGNEPAHIRSYAAAHNTFPHETTANQWFSESQFEAYRGLGAHIAELICSGGQEVPAMAHPQSIDLQDLRKQAEMYLAGIAGSNCRPVDPNVE